MPKERVEAAAREWAVSLAREHPEVVRVGYFGSYSRGDYVPSSDLDVLIEVSQSQLRPFDRAADLYTADLPVGMDVFVYTSDELARMRAEGSAFIKTIDEEIRWLT